MAQTNQATFYADGLFEDYTPSSAVTAGVPFALGGKVVVAPNDIAASTLGAVQVSGLFKLVQAAEIIPIGADVWWDSDGDPVGGTAGTGAVTATPQAAADGFLVGVCRLASVAADEAVVVELNAVQQGASIAAPTGGGTVDAESRTAIGLIITQLENSGVILPA